MSNPDLIELLKQLKNGTFMGAIKSVVVNDPSVGAQFTQTVPEGKNWIILSVRFTMQTDANVGNRTARIGFKDSGTYFDLVTATANQSAATAWSYYFSKASQSNNTAISTVAITAMGYPISLKEGQQIESVVFGMQAGDRLSSIILHVIEYDINE